MECKKATLEILLARKEQASDEKMKYRDVNVPTLGLIFTVQKLPLARVISILGEAETDTLEGKFEAYKELIYTAVPLFHSEKLQAAYELAEPYDIVSEVLEDNIQAIGELGDAIAGMYGVGVETNLKN